MSILEQKEHTVNEIVALLQNSKTTILTEYRGLNVKEMTELRKQLREAGVEFKVLKNTLTRRATSITNLTEIDDYLTGPTAIAFSSQDLVAPAKILTDYAKKYEALSIKAGIVEGKFVNVDKIKDLANLPSREGLLSMLLSVLQAPIRNMALAVKAVADKKEA